MKKIFFAAAAAAVLGAGAVHGNEIELPGANFGRLDHVFFIMMENQTNTDILGNANAPFINAYAKVANQATNYFAVGHPSAPNYLEVTGGSNFGVSNDFWPNWSNGGCVDNSPGSTGCVGAITPIAVAGVDNAVVATATNSSQCNGQVSLGGGTAVPNNCALYNYSATFFTPKSIADQLVAKRKTWKAYEESLPTVVPGVAGVNYSDGAFSNLSPVAAFGPGPIQKLYAVKHNPFVYFQNVQLGEDPQLSLERIKDFDGPDGLWADMQSGDAPNFSFIVPNQCHDMHGFVSGGTPICSASTPAEAGFLMQQGDAAVAKLVTGIKASKAWSQGRNVIILVWDEDDYSNAANRVVMLAETNYAPNGKVINSNYDHYSLLRTIEAGFGLPCLNHACDPTSKIMDDMFGGR
jgi:hypothetical protein